jgi:hypothetical protein
MTRTYYPLWYRLDESDGYLIWFSDDTDGLVTQADRTVLSFRDQETLHAYASGHQIVLDATEPLRHDLDIVARWLHFDFPGELDCRVLLSAWNLFADLAVSVNGNFDQDRKRTRHIYEKLFWGNNLPAATPSGEHYTPVWSEAEVLLMREVLTEGLQLFRTHILV